MNKNRVTAIIPARIGSSRLPGKPLADICGKPMILRVVERVAKMKCIDRTAVATDSSKILDCVEARGFKAVMTSPDHPSGTDRLAEAARILGVGPGDIVINVQGDQPLVDEDTVETVIDALITADSAVMSTAACPVGRAEAADPNRVKVVLDVSGRALYFSRSLIPFDRDQALEKEDRPYLRHLGLYAYRMDFLQKFVSLPEGRLESVEKLEQLRALENGFDILVKIVEKAPVDVDTGEDLERVRIIFSALNQT